MKLREQEGVRAAEATTSRTYGISRINVSSNAKATSRHNENVYEENA